MAEPPVYTPPQQNTAYPQGQAVAYPQGQPAAYPQGQQVAYPQGQPVAYPPGQQVTYPQGQPVAYPQGQPGGVYPPGQQVVITQGAPATHVYQTGSSQGCCDTSTNTAEHFNGKAGLGTGVVHLVVGILSIILGGVGYAFPVYTVGYGIWFPILFIIPTGILGVVSKNKSSCVIIGYMIMSILCTWIALGMLAYEATIAAVFTNYQSCYYSFIGYDRFYNCNAYHSTGALVVHSILAVLALIEVINSIVGAAYCCGGHPCCCGPTATSQSTTTTIQYGQTAAQPMTVTAQKYAPGPGGP